MIPCTSCRRHVRETESRCPFCGACIDAACTLKPSLGPVAGRVALVVVAGVLTACSGGTLYGGPVYEPPPHDAGASDAGSDGR